MCACVHGWLISATITNVLLESSITLLCPPQTPTTHVNTHNINSSSKTRAHLTKFSCPSTTLLVLLHFSKLGQNVFKCMNKVRLSGINITDYKQVSRKSCNFNFRYLRGYSDNLLHYTSAQLFCVVFLIKGFRLDVGPAKNLNRMSSLLLTVLNNIVRKSHKT